MERSLARVLAALKDFSLAAIALIAFLLFAVQGSWWWLLLGFVAGVLNVLLQRVLGPNLDAKVLRNLLRRSRPRTRLPAPPGRPVPPTPQAQLAPGPPVPPQPQPIGTPPAGGLNESENTEMNTILTLLALGVAALCALVEFQVLAVNYVPEPIDLGKIILTWPAIIGGLLALAFVVQSLILRARRRKNNWRRTGVDWFTTLGPAGAFGFGAFILVTKLVAQSAADAASFDVNDAQALVLVGFGLFHLAYDLPSLFIGEKVEATAQQGVNPAGVNTPLGTIPWQGVAVIPLQPGRIFEPTWRDGP